VQLKNGKYQIEVVSGSGDLYPTWKKNLRKTIRLELVFDIEKKKITFSIETRVSQDPHCGDLEGNFFGEQRNWTFWSSRRGMNKEIAVKRSVSFLKENLAS